MMMNLQILPAREAIARSGLLHIARFGGDSV
jgi:hypothetical protein